MRGASSPSKKPKQKEIKGPRKEKSESKLKSLKSKQKKKLKLFSSLFNAIVAALSSHIL